MAGRSDLRVIRMRDSHLPEVFSLIDKENWGWEFAEIQQIYRLDPGSSVVALDGRDVAGLVTCIDFGSTAFIVHVIVRNGWRRRGVGVRMMENVLADLDSRGASTVELHANPEAVDFYGPFSFKRLEDISYYSKVPPHTHHRARPDRPAYSWLSPGDTSLMSEVMSSSTGYVRDDLERALSCMPPGQVLAKAGDCRTSALLLSRTGLELNGAGPWFMDGPTKAEAEGMMQTMLSAVPAKRTDVLAPESNEVAKAALESCGFSLAKAGIVRLARSSRPTGRFPSSVLSIGHLGLI